MMVVDIRDIHVAPHEAVASFDWLCLLASMDVIYASASCKVIPRTLHLSVAVAVICKGGDFKKSGFTLPYRHATSKWEQVAEALTTYVSTEVFQRTQAEATRGRF